MPNEFKLFGNCINFTYGTFIALNACIYLFIRDDLTLKIIPAAPVGNINAFISLKKNKRFDNINPLNRVSNH